MTGLCDLCRKQTVIGANVTLIGAAVDGHTECIKALLDLGADVNYRDQNGLALNIKNETVNSFRNRRGYTSLMHASEAGKEHCVGLIVKSGDDVNMANAEGDTAIIAASKGGNLNIVKFLLESGADVNAVGTLGNTALMEAARNDNENCVKLLCDSGANVNRIDNGSYSALLLAAVHDNHKNIQVLTRAGACVNTRELRGKTALTITVEFHQDKCIEALIAGGADGRHLLVAAVERGSVKLVKWLLRVGVRINTNRKLLDKFTLYEKSRNWQDKTMFLLLFASGDVAEDHDTVF